MKTPTLPLSGALAFALLVGCKPAADSVPAPAKTGETQEDAPAAGGLVEIPVAADGASPQLLSAATTISGGFNAPRTGEVRGAGIQIGNFGGTADGTASLRLCQDEKCQEATAAIAGSTDNSYLEFHLPSPLAVMAGKTVTFTFTRMDGTQPFAIWTYASSTGNELTLPDATKVARDAKIALTF